MFAISNYYNSILLLLLLLLLLLGVALAVQRGHCSIHLVVLYCIVFCMKQCTLTMSIGAKAARTRLFWTHVPLLTNSFMCVYMNSCSIIDYLVYVCFICLQNDQELVREGRLAPRALQEAGTLTRNQRWTPRYPDVAFSATSRSEAPGEGAGSSQDDSRG